MDGEPFSHRTRADVPEDARRGVRRLVAGGSGSEGVVEADNFQEYDDLERLERDGTPTRRCRKLSRVDSPSSLRTGGDVASKLCPPLTEMNLPEGLGSIGWGALWGHSFQQITIPSSVREIGVGAFMDRKNLRKVTLAGGTVMVGRDAFLRCPQLRDIATPSVAIVVEDGEYDVGNSRAEVVTGGTITNRELEPTRLILMSPYLTSMQSEGDDTKVDDVTRVRDAINRIASGRPRGKGPLDLAAGSAKDLIRVRQGADRIRSRFLGLLSAHRRVLASILERAPVWESAGGGIEPGVIDIMLSFLGDVEG